MKPYYELVKEEDSNIHIAPLFADDEIAARHEDYEKLSSKKFDYDFRYKAFKAVEIIFFSEVRKIQYNFCCDPFCVNFGQSQEKTQNEESRNYSRYTYVSAKKKINKKTSTSAIKCNMKFNPFEPKYEHHTILTSNWSIAYEIRRLAAINMVKPAIQNYHFHRDSCTSTASPNEEPSAFRKRGKSSSKSQKYQCKECGKITNVLPSAEENFSYGQKRNDILLQFCQCITSRIPVKKTCELLHISPSTYYAKLEWIYRKCLEFNRRHETPKLKQLSFRELWLNPDFLQYNLNNIKQKGMAKIVLQTRDEHRSIDRHTYILATTDLKSRYAFRADVAYDPGANLDQIEADTLLYHCDHTYTYLRKNDRYTQSYAPIAPSVESTADSYFQESIRFNERKAYVPGNHVKRNYTAMAHFYLIKELLSYNKLYVVSDDDSTLQNCIFRIFMNEFRNRDAAYFNCLYEKELTLSEAGKKSFKTRNDLVKWGNAKGAEYENITQLATQKILSDIQDHDFCDYKEASEIMIPTRGSYPIAHPLPDKSEGVRLIYPISPVDHLSKEGLAKLLCQVNSRAVNNFFQELRRRVLILERPLMTSRGNGMSYIYSNYNPKYAQQMVTIFRTYYNFVWTKRYGTEDLTPAQKLGIADRKYKFRDIVYFR